MNHLRSMRQKVVVVVALTTLAALAVALASMIFYDLRSYHQRVAREVSSQADLLGHMTAPALSFDDPVLASENLQLLGLRSGMLAAAIYNADGTLFASWAAPGEPRSFPLQPEAASARSEGRRFVLFKRIEEHGELLGTVYVRTEYLDRERLRDYIIIALSVMLLALATAVLLARRLSRVITRPVFEITDIAREVIATRDYSRRAPRTSADEVGELVDSFNTMLGEIEQRTGELEQSNRDSARESGKLARARQEVMRLNEELEQRVHERTMQLEMANAELGAAIEEARNANMAKTAFLSSMSHELRTPLNAILGFAQILNSDTLPTTPEQKKEFAGHIHKSGRHLLTLINEILDLAKVESGAVALSLEPVALADTLAECRGMVEPLAARRGIRVLFPDNCQYVVHADRTRLKQVVLNLLSNAIKYNRDAGAVVLDCTVPAGGRVRIAVRDTGMGLAQDKLDQLFQPFNRLGQEGGPEEGTGIGLVVTRRLVELMGGAIGVSSSVGVGSVFWVEFELDKPQCAPPAPAAGPEPASAARHAVTHTLLYVEDNPANMRLVEEIVRLRPRLRLLGAEDAHDGIGLAQRCQPDLILLDLNLPGMSGQDAFRELRANPRTAHIPVIAVSANAMPGDVERGLALGFDRYLTKPLNIDEFNDAIDATLAQLDRQRNVAAGA